MEKWENIVIEKDHKIVKLIERIELLEEKEKTIEDEFIVEDMHYSIMALTKPSEESECAPIS